MFFLKQKEKEREQSKSLVFKILRLDDKEKKDAEEQQIRQRNETLPMSKHADKWKDNILMIQQ